MLAAPNLAAAPTPWTIERGWWTKLADDSDQGSEKRIRDLVQSLQNLDEQVPEDSQELVRVAVEGLSRNVDQFLQLRAEKGWAIEAAPAPLEVYSLDDLLTAAQQVTRSRSEWLNTVDKIKRLGAILQQARSRADELYDEYGKTAEKSLQRTVTGLSLMVVVTSRAVLEQRVRLVEEKKGGIEQREGWEKSILAAAKERLSLETADTAEFDKQIAEARNRERSLQKELLQMEADLGPNGAGEQLDNRSLNAIKNLILHSRAQVQVIVGKAKKGVVALVKEDLATPNVRAFWESSKEWLKQLDKIEDQAEEWTGLLRRAQDAAARIPLGEEVTDEANSRAILAFQRAAREALDNLDGLNVEVFQATLLAKMVSTNAVHQLHWIRFFWERVYWTVEGAVIQFSNWLSFPLFWVAERPITIFKLLRAFSVILLAYGFSLFLRWVLGAVAKRKPHISKASLYTFNRVAHYFILFVGFIWALSLVGLDFSNLLIIAGALSVGIGFGLQGIVNNFLGGLIVLFDRKLRVGDFIELSGGEMGHITEVNVQNTVIRTLTGHDVLVPNSEIISRQLTNWTLRDQFARLHLPFGVAYGSDKNKVKEVIEAAARRVAETVMGHKTVPDPNVWLVGFGDSSLNFELVVWVDFKRTKKRQSSLYAAYFWEIETALTENGIVIPFPQRDVHLKSGREQIREHAKR